MGNHPGKTGAGNVEATPSRLVTGGGHIDPQRAVAESSIDLIHHIVQQPVLFEHVRRFKHGAGEHDLCLIKPSASIVSFTFDRAATRFWNAINPGNSDRSSSTSRAQLVTVKQQRRHVALRAEYALTDLGREMLPAIHALASVGQKLLSQWGATLAEKIEVAARGK